MAKNIYVTVRLVIEDDGIFATEIVDDMGYQFTFEENGKELIVDSEIVDYWEGEKKIKKYSIGG